MKIFMILGAILTTITCNPFKTLFSWKQIDFSFPNDSMRQSYKVSGDFIQENVIPLGLNVWNDKLFITIPRWKKGVPANLNFISMDKKNGVQSPTLQPYPNWEANDKNSVSGIVNILRVRIDACNRLWGVDSGVEDILGEFKQIKPNRLIAIDLKTNQIILTYTFKDMDIKPQTFFADTVIDVDPTRCDDAHVYISDLGAYGLVVYSLSRNESWRISHNYFHFDPLNGDFDINGITFQWTDGIFGLVLTPPEKDNFKTLYFHSMSGIHEFSVSTEIIKNQTALSDPQYWKQFNVVGNKGKNSQGTSAMMDYKSGIIYFTQVNRNALACWNPKFNLSGDTFRIVARDDEKLVFPNDIVIEQKTNLLYCLADNLHLLHFGKYDSNAVNFYVHVASLDDLTTICDSQYP